VPHRNLGGKEFDSFLLYLGSSQRILWDVVQCSLVGVYLCSTLKMEAVRFSEISVNFYEVTRHHILNYRFVFIVDILLLIYWICRYHLYKFKLLTVDDTRLRSPTAVQLYFVVLYGGIPSMPMSPKGALNFVCTTHLPRECSTAHPSHAPDLITLIIFNEECTKFLIMRA
jgi:hypothetical protein